MPRYKIQWTEEVWYEVEVEASDAVEADRIWSEELDWSVASVLGSEVQDSVIITEVTE